jgi:hypothetical protein
LLAAPPFEPIGIELTARYVEASLLGKFDQPGDVREPFKCWNELSAQRGSLRIRCCPGLILVTG